MVNFEIQGETLVISDDKKSLKSLNSELAFPIQDSVIRFLSQKDDFYEGAYLNRVKFSPKSDTFLSSLPLWLISNGFLWEVRKQFKPGSTIIELGCASGVDYFGKRFKMVGLDLSFQSLKSLTGYQYALQADATQIPLANESVDGIVSSYFWEHIPADIKEKMLKEFMRVLRPGGKVVFLYDVETENGLINQLKKKNISLYNKLFLDGDGHFGYEVPLINKRRFEKYGFEVIKHFGMERTWLLSNSVYEKFRHLNGFLGLAGKIGNSLSSGKIMGYANMLGVRIVDSTIGKLWPVGSSRIIITVAKKSV